MSGVGDAEVVCCLLGGGAGFGAEVDGPGLAVLVGPGAARVFHDSLRRHDSLRQLGRLEALGADVRVLFLVFAPRETLEGDRLAVAVASGREWNSWSSVPVFLSIDGDGRAVAAGAVEVEWIAAAANSLVAADRAAGFSALPWDSTARMREVVWSAERVTLGVRQLDPADFTDWDEIEARELDLVGGSGAGGSLHRHLEDVLERTSPVDVGWDELTAPAGPVGWWILSDQLMQGLVATGAWFDRDAIAHFFGGRAEEAVFGDTDDAIRGIEAYQEWFHFVHRAFERAPTAAEAMIATGGLPPFAERALRARAEAAIHVVRVAQVEPGAAFEVLLGGRGDSQLVIDPKLSTTLAPGDWLTLRLFKVGEGALGRQMSPVVADPERLFGALAELGLESASDGALRGVVRIGELWQRLAAAEVRDRRPSPREHVLVSACLMGRVCTYRGDTNADDVLQNELERHGLVPVPFCPEESGGLPTPRAPADLSAPASEVLDGDGKVRTDRGVDVTQAFLRGAERALAACHSKGIRRAYLKERSPSCGCASTYVRGELVQGPGVTTALLRRHGIRCEGVEGRRTLDDRPVGCG